MIILAATLFAFTAITCLSVIICTMYRNISHILYISSESHIQTIKPSKIRIGEIKRYHKKSGLKLIQEDNLYHMPSVLNNHSCIVETLYHHAA